MSGVCSAADCLTASWEMIPDPECDGCGRPVCSTHAALLDVDATGRPMVGNARGLMDRCRTEWLCLGCQTARLQFCVNGHNRDEVGEWRNGGRRTHCRACAGHAVAS